MPPTKRPSAGKTTDPIAKRVRIISDSLHVRPVALVPEIRIYTAHSGSRLSRFAGRSAAPVYWAYPWAGGQLLARYILDNPETVAARRVLDLGSGSGLVAIAASIAGAHEVAAADIDPNAVAVITLNAGENRVSIAVTSADILDGPAPAVDVITVGDLFYEETTAVRATSFLDRARESGITVLIGDPYRAHLPLDRLRLLALYDVVDFGQPKGAVPEKGGVFAFERPYCGGKNETPT